MKKHFLLGLTAVAAMCLFSCNKENVTPSESTQTDQSRPHSRYGKGEPDLGSVQALYPHLEAFCCKSYGDLYSEYGKGGNRCGHGGC